ncbi:hypothetical protein ACTG2I_02605 [Aeromonas caviae]
MGDVEGIAGEGRIRTITQDGALIAGQQGAQHQRVLPARLAQHRGHQAAGKQVLQGNPEVVIGTEAMIRPRGPQGEQAALSGQGQQGAGGSDQDLPVRLCRHQRGGGLPQPGGKQVAGKENAIWRADRPGCHFPRLPFAKQQPPAVSLVLPGLQRRLPGGAPEHTLDQQIHSFPHIRPPRIRHRVPGRHHTPV